MLGVARLVVQFPTGTGNFSLSHTVSRTHSVPCTIITGSFFPGLKRPGCDAELSPSAVPSVIMKGPLPPLSLYGWFLAAVLTSFLAFLGVFFMSFQRLGKKKWVFENWDGGGTEWIDLAQDRDRLRAGVNEPLGT
jgi:hypothetical protein